MTKPDWLIEAERRGWEQRYDTLVKRVNSIRWRIRRDGACWVEWLDTEICVAKYLTPAEAVRRIEALYAKEESDA